MGLTRSQIKEYYLHLTRHKFTSKANDIRNNLAGNGGDAAEIEKFLKALDDGAKIGLGESSDKPDTQKAFSR